MKLSYSQLGGSPRLGAPRMGDRGAPGSNIDIGKVRIVPSPSGSTTQTESAPKVSWQPGDTIFSKLGVPNPFEERDAGTSSGGYFAKTLFGIGGTILSALLLTKFFSVIKEGW